MIGYGSSALSCPLTERQANKITVGLQTRWFSGREMELKAEEWLDEALASHARLTPVVASLVEWTGQSSVDTQSPLCA